MIPGFEPYPAPGIVTRIEAGWPPGAVLPNLSISEPPYLPTAEEKDQLMGIVRHWSFTKFLFDQIDLQTMRDVDVGTLAQILRDGGWQKPDESAIDTDVVWCMIIQCVRETWDLNDEFT